MKSKAKAFLSNTDVVELLKRSGLSLSMRLVGVAFTYLLAVFFIKKFGIEEWGAFMLCFTIFQISLLFSRLGVDKHFMIHTSKVKSGNAKFNITDLYKKSRNILVVSGLLVVGLILVLSDSLSNLFFQNEEYSFQIKLIGLAIIPASTMMLNAEGLRAIKQNVWYSFLEKGGYFTFTFIALSILSAFYESRTIQIISLIVATLLLSALSHVLWKKKSQNLFPDSGENESSSDIVKNSLPLLLSGSGFLLMSWIDVIALGIFENSESVGAFNIAARIASINSLVLVAINTVNGPKIASLISKNEPMKLQAYIKNSNFITGIIGLPILVIIFIFPSFLISIFDSKLVSPVLIASLFILAVGEFTNAVCGSVGLLLQTSNNQKVFQNIILVSACINILLSLLLIPKFGILGAAIANSAATILWNLASAVAIKKKLGFSILPNFKIQAAK